MKNDKIIKKEVKLIKAKKEDSSEILKFVKDLAECEQILHEVTATKEDIEDGLFNNSNQKKTLVEVVFAQIDGQNVGFCLYFYNFPTFIGKPGIFIEDMGAKLGNNEVDSGRLKFDNIRIPRENILNRFSDVL